MCLGDGIKFDLHVHSIYSLYDALPVPEEIVKIAVRRGLDGIGITDHNTVAGGLRARKFAAKKYPNFEVIPGCEIKSREGMHILALGINSWEKVKNLSAVEVVEKIHELDGVSIAAHPFRKFWKREFDETVRFDAIEVLSGGALRVCNLKARMLAKRMRLPGVAGSDAHLREYIGCVYTICESDVLQDIRKGKVEVGGNPPSNSSIIFEKIKRSIIYPLSINKIWTK